jgi:hypothetical protein
MSWNQVLKKKWKNHFKCKCIVVLSIFVYDLKSNNLINSYGLKN